MSTSGVARPVTLTIHDVRSVHGGALEVPLGPLTVLVGPNRAGTSNVAWALALALDAGRSFVPDRDLPRGPGVPPGRAEPWVRVTWDDHATTVVRPDGEGARRVEGRDAGGHVILARIQDTPRDLVAALPAPLAPPLDATFAADLAAHVAAVDALILPEAVDVTVEPDGRVVVRDDRGGTVPVPETRALVAIGLARTLVDRGSPPAALVVEAPDAFLHPAAQERIATLLLDLALDADLPVVVTTTSPFALPRRAEARVVSLYRDADGRTRLVGAAHGDAPQARLLSGLLRDEGLADVLDRTGPIGDDVRAVLIVEGGTDVAYLRLAAERLGRQRVLDGVLLRSGGGAMGAALAAIVLRAESDVRVLVLLDHDDQGRRARDTLVSRFEFDRRREVLTYADVFEGGPVGVEAEALFAPHLLEAYVARRGRSALSQVRELPFGRFLDLTSAGKAGFVPWVEEHARREDLERWGRLLDLVAGRLGT